MPDMEAIRKRIRKILEEADHTDELLVRELLEFAESLEIFAVELRQQAEELRHAKH